jgi:hypothetical protein
VADPHRTPEDGFLSCADFSISSRLDW